MTDTDRDLSCCAPSTLASSALDASRARREAARSQPDWSLERSIGAVDRLVRAVVAHTDDGVGGLAELHALVRLQREVTNAIDNVARHLLAHDDYTSYKNVGIALGITRQAVAQRYPGASSRPAGGQPGPLR